MTVSTALEKLGTFLDNLACAGVLTEEEIREIGEVEDTINYFVNVKNIENDNEQIYQYTDKGMVKMVGDISLTTWKEKFADLVRLAIDKDYFSDTLFDELYPNISAEAAAIDEDDEEAQCDIYNEKWEYAHKAFEEIFGEKFHK